MCDKRLSKEEKFQVLKEFKASGWSGCMCDDCLVKLAEVVLEHQLKKNKLK